MSIELCASPYNLMAACVYFSSYEEYLEKTKDHTDCCGYPVEEFKTYPVDASQLDAALFGALNIDQDTLEAFFTLAEEWSGHDKIKAIVKYGRCGYAWDGGTDSRDVEDVDIYYRDSMSELAEQFVEDGIFGDLPEHLLGYLDYDAIAADLHYDYTEAEIAGEHIIYRMA